MNNGVPNVLIILNLAYLPQIMLGVMEQPIIGMTCPCLTFCSIPEDHEETKRYTSGIGVCIHIRLVLTNTYSRAHHV